MQKIKHLFLMAVVCTVAFSSCKKDSKKPTTPVSTQSISLTFNGTAFSSTAPVALYSKSQGILLITGPFGTTAAISLSINGTIQAGTYDLTSGNALATFATGTNLQDVYTSDSGSIVITQLTSTTVSGTFQFTGTNFTNAATGTVTQGKFQANLTTQQ
jgi:hypothetical protein